MPQDSQQNDTMMSVSTSHDKIPELLKPYLPACRNETTLSKDERNHEGLQSQVIMDESLFDFGCKYRLVVHRIGDDKEDDANVVIAMHIAVMGWDKVKDPALTALRLRFGRDAILVNEDEEKQKGWASDTLSTKTRGYSEMPLLNTVHPDYCVAIQIHNQMLTTSNINMLAGIRRIILGQRLQDTFTTLAQSSTLTNDPNHGKGADHASNSNAFVLPLQRIPHTRKGAPPIFQQHQSMLICPTHDRVTVIFPVYFEDATDQAIAKLFLQQFKQAQLNTTSKNSPICDYRRGCDPPRELSDFLEQGSGNKEIHTNIAGFVSFTFLEAHVDNEKKLEDATDNMLIFIDFLDYHVKCSKTYMHKRMRDKKDALLEKLHQRNS
jgi:hypothetical protein